MENLQPLEAYVEGMSAVWTRQGRLVGIMFGAVSWTIERQNRLRSEHAT